MKSMPVVASAASHALLRRQNLSRHFPTISTKLHSLNLPRIGNVNHTRPNFRLLATAASGADPLKIDVPKSVPVRVAHELNQAGHRYLDVRTPEEFTAGHPLGAVNIPYMFKAGNGMTKNPNFLKEVSKQFGKDTEIIIGCQSGKRSLMAATDLCAAGFTGVTDIAGGYSAWIQSGLPTE